MPSIYPMAARQPKKLPQALPARQNLQHRDTNTRLEATSVFSVSVASQQLSTPSLHSHNEENYGITRFDSHSSLNSMISTQSQYKVNLTLTAKEISLLRYTWNKMLSEELFEEPQVHPIPQFSGPGSFWKVTKEKQAQPVTQRQSMSASSTFCSQMYLNILSRAPDLEIAFPSLRHQAVSFAGTISLAMNALDNLPSLDEYLIELGNRHLRILGTEPAQFELMGELLIQTFQERFGTRFTHELEVLWIKFFMYLANSILQFGMDPLLKLNNNDLAPLEVCAELILTNDSENISISKSSRRNSFGTEMLSVTLTTVEELKSRIPKINSLLGSKTNKPEKKKKLRFGRKQGECVIT